MNLDMLPCKNPASTSGDATLDGRPAHRARSAFDLWQDHARKSFEVMHRAEAEEPDTVHLFKVRRLKPSGQFAQRLSRATRRVC